MTEMAVNAVLSVAHALIIARSMGIRLQTTHKVRNNDQFDSPRHIDEVLRRNGIIEEASLTEANGRGYGKPSRRGANVMSNLPRLQ